VAIPNTRGKCLEPRTEGLLEVPDWLVHRWEWSPSGNVEVAVEDDGNNSTEADD
jgi:hypothetical protein